MFIKRNKFGRRGKNVQWLYECPDCGALMPMTPDEAKTRRTPCGNVITDKTINGRIAYTIETLKAFGVNYTYIPGALWFRLPGHHKSNYNLLNALAISGVNMNFIYGRSCSIFIAPQNLKSCCNYFVSKIPTRKRGSGRYRTPIKGKCTVCGKVGLIWPVSKTCSKKCYTKKYVSEHKKIIDNIKKKFLEKHPNYYKRRK